MKQIKNILVATDTRFDAHPIVEEAAEIAQHNGATLKIVDVVPEFPWTVRLAMENHEHVRDLMGREKQELLERLAESIGHKGVETDVKVLFGKTSVEIIREVLRGQHDLVLRVAKGHESRHKGFFGATGRRLLRDCPCAVWLVAAANTPKFKHVMACVDTSTGHQVDAELNSKVYELAESVSRQHNALFTVLHAWQMDTEQILAGRVSPDNLAKLQQERQDYVESLLDRFLQTHGSHGRPGNVQLLKSAPSIIIPEFAKENGVDLVVMGTVARSGLTGMVIGNTAERVLDELNCSVLTLKPDSFVSPITLGEYINPTQGSSKI